MLTVLRIPVLVITLVLALTPGAAAQTPGKVRVVDPATPILRWLSPAPRDVLAVVDAGTTLEVLDTDNGWYWVVTPRDAYGTRRVGWIAARHVEVVPDAPESRVAGPDLLEATTAASASPVEESGVQPVARAVTGTESAPHAGASAKRYELEDVPFDRDRFSLRPDAIRILEAVAATMSSDALLQLTIEGHTCNLGTPAYNLMLGEHRAAAVRDYLVSQGIAADRLRTVSVGEQRPKHDNSGEETRRLNRRVELVPDGQP